MTDFTAGWLLLSLTYLALCLTGLISVGLYHHAYMKMKRTRMIRSVLFLLFAVLVENIYFMVTAIARGYDLIIQDVLHDPYFWFMPKLVLLFALIYFIYASITPTKEAPCNALHNAQKKLSRRRKS